VNVQQMLQTLIVESREQLAAMEAGLLAVEQQELDSETLNAVFRAAHTIKGSAGLFDLDHIVAFAHVLESVLDAVRAGKLLLAADLVALLLSCCDHLGALVDALEAGRLEPEESTALIGRPLTEKLLAYLQELQPQPGAVAHDTAPQPGSAMERVEGSASRPEHWHISLRFGRAVLRNGMDPLSFLRHLEKFGSIVALVTLFDGIPAAEEMDPQACYLGFEIAFRSDSDQATIENVFDFVRDDCEVRILPPRTRVSRYIQLIQELPEDRARLGEILVSCGSLTPEELEAALAQQRAAPASMQQLGAVLVERGSVHPAVLDAALAKQRYVDVKAQESRSVRVDADKLDHLINLVGELIIAAASTSSIARQTRLPELQQSTAALSTLVEALRDDALQLRMVKIGATFTRFQRVVHDVSRELGKEIALVVSGEDAELDKTVVEKIGDPLMHLVRNAIDHGIEPPEVRKARGKPAKGTVSLHAFHDSGSIVIEVSDDGGGLHRDKILSKAAERGLVEPGQALSDSEIYALIFEPGFSTAEQVTNLSGRGVGMDVVKQNITALRGGVSIATEAGVGTTVTVRLPLTLAIINGFLVGLGKSVFVVPVDTVEECLEFTSAPESGYANLRGHVLPFIRLRELFKLEGNPAARENIVVVQAGGQRAGLLVDSLLGEFQTVIKPLSAMFNRVKCISGSTILGSGDVALILDVPTLLRHAAQGAVAN
jgi:two-component system chemotaxis sensor kinase CheA